MKAEIFQGLLDIFIGVYLLFNVSKSEQHIAYLKKRGMPQNLVNIYLLIGKTMLIAGGIVFIIIGGYLLFTNLRIK